MSLIKDWAKAYAAAGWPVLRLYRMEEDEDGNWVCNCGRPAGSKSCNPGKHPPFHEHGVLDATTDLDIIDSWPEEGINIGIAGRDTYAIVDIDHDESSDKLEAELIRLGAKGVVRTGGGTLHCYLQCAPTKNGVLFRADGVKIGEVRSAGYYVVAPPSNHESGNDYVWLTASILEGGPEVTSFDAWGWFTALSETVGIKIRDKKHQPIQGREIQGNIIPIPIIPFVTDNSRLQAMMLDSYPVAGDRSDELFTLACEIVRECNAVNWVIDEDITLETIAGMVKHADTVRVHPRGPKFAHRHNGDKYFWDLVNEAVNTVANSPAAQARLTEYGYNEDDGFYFETTGAKGGVSRQRIANFEPKWIESLVTWKGEHQDDDELEVRRLQVIKGAFTKIIEIKAKEYDDDRLLAKAVKRRLPSHLVIEPRMSGYFETGLGYYSGEIPTRQVFAATGWLPDRDAFLLPGFPGAITPAGVDSSTVFETTDATDMMYERTYNEGADVEAELRVMFSTIPPSILVPILAQIMASPLCSLGLEERTMMHLLGETGSYKSSLIAALLSVYGYVKGDAQGRVSWQGGTEHAIRARQHNFRDLPVLIDDFKTGLVAASLYNKIIQGYGDNTGRQRMTRDLRQQESHVPRGLTLSSGEQWWGGQRSTNYRTLLVRMKKGAMTLSQIIALADEAKAGRLAVIGIRWIQWLARMGRDAARARLEEETIRLRPRIADMVGEEHARHVSAISMLFAVNAMMLDFVKETAPKFADEYRDKSNIGWAALLGSAKDQAEEGQDVSPLSQILSILRMSVQNGLVYLAPRTAGDDAYGTPMGRVVGYYSNGAMFLNEHLTYGWYLTELRSQGRSPSVDWESIKQDAKENFGGTYNAIYYKGAGASRERFLRLEVELLDANVTDASYAIGYETGNEVTEFE